MTVSPSIFFFFFFNDTATTEIYTLSLHDALPILEDARSEQLRKHVRCAGCCPGRPRMRGDRHLDRRDRKSTRLNSSHLVISYAVFCLKKKKRVHVCVTCTEYRCVTY